MICKSCKQTIPDYSYFCFHCGCCQNKDSFNVTEVVESYETDIRSMVSSLSAVSHKTVRWNSTVDSYIKKIEMMKVLLSNEVFASTSSSLIKKCDAFIGRCKSPEFHIAFVGTIKAGKSTLINALLGQNLASTSVTPETAVLTKFRHCEYTNYVRVSFYSQDEWKMLWDSISSNADVFKQEYASLHGDAEKQKWIDHTEVYTELSDDDLNEEIERWTSSKHAEHYFVKEVEVGLRNFKMPEQIVFVDTPGLDDAVKYRSDVTRNYIDRANAVFACVKSDSLTGPELTTLIRIFANTSYNPEKVFVIGTQWDSLNSPEKDWKKQKTEWVKYLSGQDCYGNSKTAERNIVYTAAYLNNLCRDYLFLDEDQKYTLMSTAMKFKIMPQVLEEHLEKLMQMSNVDSVEVKISQDILSKYQDYLLSDIEQNMNSLNEDLNKYFAEIKESNQKILEASNQNIEEIRAQYDEAKRNLDQIDKYKSDLVNVMKLVKEDTERRVQSLVDQLKDLVND